MRLFFYILVCCLLILNLKAQDTLYLKSGEFVSTKILEISPTQVSYKKFDNMDGPIYKLIPYQITKIKYQNGVVEFFKDKELLEVYKDNQSITDNTKITVLKGTTYYKGFPISNKGILKLILAYPKSETKTLLLKEHKQLRRNNRNRITWLSIGIYSSAMIPFFMYLSSSNHGGDYYTMLGSGFAYSFTFVGISQICNYRYHKKKKHIIATYNNF
jgi:hypothetical protein